MRELAPTCEPLRVSVNNGSSPKKSNANTASSSTTDGVAEVLVRVTEAAGTAGALPRLLHAAATSVVTTILRRCSPRGDIP
jgi:hypothetical protein